MEKLGAQRRDRRSSFFSAFLPGRAFPQEAYLGDFLRLRNVLRSVVNDAQILANGLVIGL